MSRGKHTKGVSRIQSILDMQSMLQERLKGVKMVNDRIEIPKIRKCPCCGKDSGQLVMGLKFWMECSACGYQTDILDTAEQAVNQWNSHKAYSNCVVRHF